MNIVFSATSMSDLTLERGRLYPLSNTQQINQERHLTEGNAAKIINYGDNLKLMQINLMYLTKDNFDGSVNGLKIWFEDSNINWSENAFTLTDEDGVAHTVRYWSDTFNMPEQSSGRYLTSLTLKEE